MEKIEGLLNNAKKELDQVETPEELEARLRTALANRKKTPNYSYGIIAMILIVMILATTFNYHAIAYYGKKILGFDQVVYGTLKDLNELGQGQLVGESYLFQNGIEVILDGVMIDDNQLIAFYTVNDPSGQAGKDLLGIIRLQGTFGQYHQVSGVGNINEDGTEVKWIQTFNAPRAFERTLSLNFLLNHPNSGNQEEGQIKFKLDRSKAMGAMVKQKINQSIATEFGPIHFDSITASPTMTKVEGTFKTIGQLVAEKITGKGEKAFPHLELELVADGKKLESSGKGMSISTAGGTFEFRFEGLTNRVDSLELKLLEFMASKEINKTIQLNTGIEDLSLELENTNIIINRISYDSQAVYLTVQSAENITLEEVHLLAAGEQITLADIINPDYHKDENDGTISYQRTLVFETPEKVDLALELKRVSYPKYYNQVIQIPVK